MTDDRELGRCRRVGSTEKNGCPSDSVVPYAETYREIVGQVLAAEREGLELVGIQDHPYQRRFLDTFALIGELLARTERLRFFPDVASLPMRPPAMLAKAAASLDVMSGGRFELGIGAGAFWDAVAGMGGQVRRSVDERLEALGEAMDIIRAALDVGPEKRVVRGTGPHYPIPGYPAGPTRPPRRDLGRGDAAPNARSHRPPGGRLGAVGRRRRHRPHPIGTRRIDDAALAAGRSRSDVLRVINVGRVITDGERGDGPLIGPVDQWVETLVSWAVEIPADAFIVWPPDADPGHVERLAAEVVPAVRELLAAKAD